MAKVEEEGDEKKFFFFFFLTVVVLTSLEENALQQQKLSQLDTYIQVKQSSLFNQKPVSQDKLAR